MLTSHLTFSDMVVGDGGTGGADGEEAVAVAVAMGGKVRFRPPNRASIGDGWMQCGQFECDGTSGKGGVAPLFLFLK